MPPFQQRAARQPVVVMLLIALALALMASLAFYRQATRARVRAEADVLKAGAALIGKPVGGDEAPGQARRLDRVLAESSARITESMNGKPAVAAALRLTIGRSYVQLGEYEKAERELLAAHELCGALEGIDATRSAVVSQLVQLYERWHEAAPDADHATEAQRWRGSSAASALEGSTGSLE